MVFPWILKNNEKCGGKWIFSDGVLYSFSLSGYPFIHDNGIRRV
jgi:hypothetical protein